MKNEEPDRAEKGERVDMTIANGVARPVREGLFEWPSEKPALIGHRCKCCGSVFFPRRFICPECFKEETLEEIPLSRRGTLYTFCILERGPMGFDPPYAVGYVDLPEGLRIYSLLTAESMEELRIGMEMELVIEKIRQDSEGNEIIGYKFKPTEGKQEKARIEE